MKNKIVSILDIDLKRSSSHFFRKVWIVNIFVSAGWTVPPTILALPCIKERPVFIQSQPVPDGNLSETLALAETTGSPAQDAGRGSCLQTARLGSGCRRRDPISVCQHPSHHLPLEGRIRQAQGPFYFIASYRCCMFSL